MSHPENLARNSFKDFISEVYHAKMAEPAMEAKAAEYESQLKPVTVRLHPDTLVTIDNLAKSLDMPRQKLLSEMIDGGIDLALTAITEANCWSDSSYHDLDDAEKLKRLQQEHSAVVKEFVA